MKTESKKGMPGGMRGGAGGGLGGGLQFLGRDLTRPAPLKGGGGFKRFAHSAGPGYGREKLRNKADHLRKANHKAKRFIGSATQGDDNTKNNHSFHQKRSP